MKLGKILATLALSTALTSGAALANGLPNEANGAKGHDMPSSSTAQGASGTPWMTGRSASMYHKMMMKKKMMMHHRMMKHRMMKKRMMHSM